MVIYLTTNMVNGKRYIGLDMKNNPSYLGSGLMLKRAIAKYGRQAINSALRGKSKTSGGFIWKYKTNVESESYNG